jgi:tetratricopeptide (TPR) repeat protein
VILGEPERARDLLARATDLDPGSAELAYRYGRILQDLGDDPGAVVELCRVLALAPDSPDAADVRLRLQDIAEVSRPRISEVAEAAFREAVGHAEAGRHDRALGGFRAAAGEAPAWPDPVYNEGVVLARMGRRAAAADALGRYLEMAPQAPDAIAVSQRIGQLQAPLNLPSPGTALALGVLPGMGQFYSGRALGGVTFLSLAAGAAAAGFLIEETEVRCLQAVPPGEDCPPAEILDETSERPYLVAGLAAAGAITVIGAIEAFVKARGRRSQDRASSFSLDLGGPRLFGPSVASRGRRIELRWARVAF